MNKRLRKKKHVGEYQLYCVELTAKMYGIDDVEKFNDEFIDAIESFNCVCGGCISEKELDIVVELGIKMNDPLSKKENLDKWLKDNKNIESYEFGDIVDGWYGKKITDVVRFSSLKS